MLKFNRDLLQEFEDQLNPADPHRGDIPVKVLGYGEISTTFQIGGIEDVAFKRMPPFKDPQERSIYRTLVDEYCLKLKTIGLDILEYDFAELTNADGEHMIYIAQPCVPAQSIGNQKIQQCRGQELQKILHPVLNCLSTLWRANQANAPREIFGLDSQLSNWIFTDAVIDGKVSPSYLDISTPLFRQDGRVLWFAVGAHRYRGHLPLSGSNGSHSTVY